MKLLYLKPRQFTVQLPSGAPRHSLFFLLKDHVKLNRPCQIDFLFCVTRAHAKKLGALNLFIQKLARQYFLFITSEKN